MEARPASDLVVPDGIMPYVGFRVWDYSWGYTYEDNVPTKHHRDRGMLRAVTAPTAWNDHGVTEARCEPARFMIRERKVGACGGTSPNPDCPHGCGLHAYHTVAVLRGNYKQAAYFTTAIRVVGAVLGWGDMIRHKDEGWRAQYAKPIALLLPQRHRFVGLAPVLQRFYREVDDLMEDLGAVRCYSYTDLENFGFENGARWIDKPILP